MIRDMGPGSRTRERIADQVKTAADRIGGSILATLVISAVALVVSCVALVVALRTRKATT